MEQQMNTNEMKAIVCTKYGTPDVLKLQQVRKPIPKGNEVLIKVHAASATTADSMMRKGSPFFGRLFLGLLKPKNPVPGTGFSGVIEAIGKYVTEFKVGDQVFGESIFGFGTNAQYTCVSEQGIIALRPSNMNYEEAAPVCDGALTSMNFLKNLANISSGQKVLIYGASGSLGTSAVQLAKYFGAEVTGVCGTDNLELVKSLGADFVIDYTEEDFTKYGKTYDIIYDTVGKISFASCKTALTENGLYLSPVLGLKLLFNMLWTSRFGSKKAKFSATGILPISELRLLFDELREIIEAGKIRSVIDKILPLEKIVEAHTYVDSGHKRGNVIITVA